MKELFSGFDNIIFGDNSPTQETNLLNDKKFKKKKNDINISKYTVKPRYEVSFRRPYNDKTQYYYKLINNEKVKLLNILLGEKLIESEKSLKRDKFIYIFTYLIDLINRKNNIAFSLRAHLPQNPNKIESEKEFNKELIDNKYITDFIKISLVHVYKELIENYSKNLPSNLLLDEIYSFLPKDGQIKQLKVNDSKNSKSKKITFGYIKCPNEESFNQIIKDLNLEIDLVDENFNSVEYLLEVLKSNNFTKLKNEIILNCETTQFRYVVDKLKGFFNYLNYDNIEESGLFISKLGNKITANGLAQAKFQTPEPKKKKEIDKIFNNYTNIN